MLQSTLRKCQKSFFHKNILLPYSPQQLLTKPTINQCLFIENDMDVSRLHGHKCYKMSEYASDLAIYMLIDTYIVFRDK